MNPCYLCVDLKRYFASAECAARGLDPFKTNLVVADDSRCSGALCLAVTPALSEYGVKNRCRLYEIPAGIDYIIAKPRMRMYGVQEYISVGGADRGTCGKGQEKEKEEQKTLMTILEVNIVL